MTSHRTSQPTIRSQRLVLRPFTLKDAPTVQRLAGHRDIADTTLRIPHPYEDGMAEEWISSLQPGFDAGAQATFAIVRRENTGVIGAIGLTIEQDSNVAELGYWIGKPFWNNGYATEATEAILAYGFAELRLSRINAQHLARNPSSGRVMQKAGMTCEGRAPKGAVKWDKHEDLVLYRITRDDWRRVNT